MNQEKIGKFIAKLRKENDMTQEQLAEKLNVTSKSVSRWENGKTLPDYSLISAICDTLKISVNEFFVGEKIKEEEFKEKADDNLLIALENSSFTLKEKIAFYKRKWKKEHISKFILCFISLIILIIALKFQNIEGYIIGTIAGMLGTLFYIILYNQIRDDASVSIDSEKSNVREVNINGTIGLLSSKENKKILAWRNNHYFYTVTAKSLSEDELIKIAKSVSGEK